MNLIPKILAICSLIGVVFSIYFFNESRYALAGELGKVSDRLEYKIQTDQLNSTKERYWKLEERVSKKPNDKEAIQEMKELKDQIDEIKENIRIIKEKK